MKVSGTTQFAPMARYSPLLPVQARFAFRYQRIHASLAENAKKYALHKQLLRWRARKGRFRLLIA